MIHAETTHLLERLSRLIQNEAHAGGLKPVQWEILRYLAMANRFSRTPAGVTAYLNLTKGTVSQSLNALDAKGFVEKQSVPGDRRRVTLALTAAGRDQLAADPLADIDRAVRRSLQGEGAELAPGLREVLRELIRQRGGRAFGVCRTCRYHRSDGAGRAHCSLLDEPLLRDDADRICVEHAV